MNEDVAFAGAVRIAAMVRAKEVSPTELVELYLERIGAIDPKLNAYRVVLAEGARADAKRAEERLAKGDAAPLLGVPVAIKDNVDYAGEVTTDGHRGLRRARDRGRARGPAAARRRRGNPGEDEPA
jgi:amidase